MIILQFQKIFLRLINDNLIATNVEKGIYNYCIDYANKYEYAISRPSVIRTAKGIYRMWYSYRAQANVATYRIGYAESNDGLKWVRMDEASGIDVSASDWDSEMICYPRVFEHKGQLFMLYNGNGYGKTGFGLAVLEEDT